MDYIDRRAVAMPFSEDRLIGGLLSLAENLNSGLSQAVRLTTLCRTTVELLDCDRSSIFIREGRYYRATYNHGNPPDIARVFAQHKVSLRDPLIARAMETRSFVVANDALHSPLVEARVAQAARIQSLVVAPLFDEAGQPLGFLTAEYNERPGAFTPSMSMLVLGCAKLAELAIVADRRNAQREQAEQRLAASENRQRAIIESEPECVKLVGADGTLLEMNAAGLAMVEADTAEQVLGKPLDVLVAPEYRAAFQDLAARVFRGAAGSLEFEMVGLKGTRRWLETHAVPLRNAQQEITALLGITRDVTDRKRAQEALRQEAEVSAALARVGQELIASVDRPAFLDRLCAVTAEVLECDVSHTLLWRSELNVKARA